MPKALKIPVQIEIPMYVRQAQILPYLKLEPLRSKFQHNRDSRHAPMLEKLIAWSKQNTKYPVMELHLPGYSWGNLKALAPKLISDPDYQIGLYFIGSKNFKQISGHPNGTAIWVINDIVYRTITCRSLTTTHWPKHERDVTLVWKPSHPFKYSVYFLYQCSKLNQEPLKSTIVDSIGLDLLKQDKPKVVRV